jgi:ABC-type oligopeptide transport system ATPase subunit
VRIINTMTSLLEVRIDGRAGQFLELGAAEQVLHQPQHGCTRELLSAVPELPRA